MTITKKQILGGSAVILAAVMWAFDGVFLLPKIRDLDVNLIVFVQHLLPFLIMSVLFIPFFATIKKDVKGLGYLGWTAFLAVAFFGGYLGTYAITKAFFAVYMEGANITMVFLLQKLQPVFAIFLALILLREKPTKNYWIFALFALIGSYLLAFGNSKLDLSLENKTLVASLFAVLAAFSWGASTVFSKFGLNKVSFFTATYLRFGLGAIIAGVITFIFSGFSSGSFSTISYDQWIVFLIIAITTGGGAIWLYYWGLKKVRASASAIYELAMPVSAVLFELYLAPYFIEGFESRALTGWQWFGAFVLVSAIFLMVGNKKKYSDTCLVGKVTGGYGVGAKFVSLYSKKFKEKLGFVPFDGTLNILLEDKFEKPAAMNSQFVGEFTHKGKKYGKVHYLNAEIEGVSCVIILPVKTSHEKRMVEVIAPYNFRKKLSFVDGSNVEIKYFN